MAKREYKGKAYDATYKHITELEEEAEEPSSNESTGTEETTFIEAFDLYNKKEKIAHVSCTENITHYRDLYNYIDENFDLSISEGYCHQILNGEVDVDGFKLENGELVEDGIEEKYADILRMLEIAELNPSMDYQDIGKQLVKEGIYFDYSKIKHYVDRFYPRDTGHDVERGKKKEAIKRAYEKTGKTGSELHEYVNKVNPYTISIEWVHQVGRSLDGYDATKDVTKKDRIKRIIKSDRYEYESFSDLAMKITEHTDMETSGHYVAECNRELEKS